MQADPRDRTPGSPGPTAPPSPEPAAHRVHALLGLPDPTLPGAQAHGIVPPGAFRYSANHWTTEGTEAGSKPPAPLSPTTDAPRHGPFERHAKEPVIPRAGTAPLPDVTDNPPTKGSRELPTPLPPRDTARAEPSPEPSVPVAPLEGQESSLPGPPFNHGTIHRMEGAPHVPGPHVPGPRGHATEKRGARGTKPGTALLSKAPWPEEKTSLDHAPRQNNRLKKTAACPGHDIQTDAPMGHDRPDPKDAAHGPQIPPATRSEETPRKPAPEPSRPLLQRQKVSAQGTSEETAPPPSNPTPREYPPANPSPMSAPPLQGDTMERMRQLFPGLTAQPVSPAPPREEALPRQTVTQIVMVRPPSHNRSRIRTATWQWSHGARKTLIKMIR